MNVVVVGASGFGRELLQYVHDAYRNDPAVRVKGFLDDDPAKIDSIRKTTGVDIVGDTLTYAIEEEDRFIISLGDPGLRRALAGRLARRGAKFISVIHPTAYLAPTARIGEGCIIGPFAMVGSYANLEDHVLLNLYSAVGHDVHIAAFSVFIGGQSLLIQCAERFKKRGHNIRTIVSSDSNVQRWAKEQRISCIAPARNLAAQLALTPFNYLFSVAYLSVIPSAVLRLPRRGAINFHDGPLPDYAGLNVTSWALLNKEREHGVTWHVMSERVDEGDILEQVRFPIAAEETALTLNAKCYQAALASFDDLLEALTNGGIHPRRQDLARRRYYAKDRRPEAAGSIDWSSPAADIAALVRGLDFGPYPNPLTTAKAWLGGVPLAVRRIEVLGSMALRPGGSVVAIGPEGLTVSTGTNDVVLSELATLLGSPLSARDLEEKYGLNEGGSFQSLGADRSRALGALAAGICKHEGFWLGRLAD